MGLLALCCIVKAHRADRFTGSARGHPRRGVLTMTGTLVRELSGYVFSPLREGDSPLYRGSGDSLAPVLVVTADDTSLVCFKRLEHEYSLRAELDVAWAARPVALSRYHGHLALVLEDPGGELLDRRLDRPLEISDFKSCHPDH
jgi:hypothetical protein